MMRLELKLDGDGCWPDLAKAQEDGLLIHLAGKPIEVALLKGGLASGAHSVAIRLDLEDGRVVMAETSAALFLAAADGIRGRIEYERGQN